VTFMVWTRPLVHPGIPSEHIESNRRELFDELGLQDPGAPAE